MKLLTILLSACFILSCVNEKQETRVMTFNIRLDIPVDGENRWEARIPVVKSYMDSVTPDIVGMQEVLHNQLTDLLEIMPEYSFIGTGRDDGRQEGEYSPLFYRNDRFLLKDHSQFWLSETPEVPGSLSWDAAITRIVSWAALEDKLSGDVLYVFNTHFDHRGVQARLNSIELMAEKINIIAGDLPVIVLGDFNISKGSDDYFFMINQFSKNNSLTNAELISKTPVTNADATFSGFRTDVEPRVIDYIFFDDSFEVNWYRVDKVIKDGVFISDHWPVVAGIEY